MRSLVTQIAAILLMTSGTSSGAVVYPNDLSMWFLTKAPDPWAVTEAPELGDARFDAALADADYFWLVYLRAGRPSARLRSLNDPAQPPLPFEIKVGDRRQQASGKGEAAQRQGRGRLDRVLQRR